jgi:hypothetical protein
MDRSTFSGPIKTASHARRVFLWHGAWLNRLLITDPKEKLIDVKYRSVDRLIEALKFLNIKNKDIYWPFPLKNTWEKIVLDFHNSKET